jgi:predicted deacylase
MVILLKSLRRHAPPRKHRPLGLRSQADRTLAHSISLGAGSLPPLGRYASAILLRSPMGRPVELHVFPGRSTRRALVVGGVHGTEFVGVEVTRRLVAELRAGSRRNERPFFTTIVVPALFPDNLPSSHGGHGRARRATRGYADPNRQFPMIGTSLDASSSRSGRGRNVPRDSRGRLIETANLAFIELIRRFRPQRIASVHAIRRPSSAGIYCDPHRGAGVGLGVEAADLAYRMHAIAQSLGAHVPGSMRGGGRYPHQGAVSEQGVSLGEWGSRAVETGPYGRDAMPVVTIELKREWSVRQARRRRSNVEAIVLAIRRGFLEL